MRRKPAADAPVAEERPAGAVPPSGEGGGSGSSRRGRKRKRSILESVRARVLTVVDLCRTLLGEPRAFPGHLKRVLRQWARDTWEAQGGGFYACGFVLTFAWLEIKLLFVELFQSTGAGDFIVEQVMQLVLRFTIDSLINTVQALIWPALVLSVSPVWGLFGLVGGYVLFTRFLKEPLTDWLFDDE